MNQQSEAVSEVVEEATTIGTEKPETQMVGVEGGATSQEEQTKAERIAVIEQSKSDAKKIIDEAGERGFILISMQDDNTAKAIMAGDYATVVHATHTAVCALGSIVKQVQGQHDGNPEKHAKVADFVAGASVLTMHDGMLAKLHAQQVEAAQAEATNQTKQ